MSKASLMAMSVVLGVAAASLGAVMPASAIQINRVKDGPPTPVGWTNLGWKVEGRAGADPSKGTQDDYELAIGPNGAQADLVAQQNWLWENGQAVNWSLNWDGSTVSFQFDNLSPISYKPGLIPGASNVFNGFYLLTKSQTFANDRDIYVDPGTTIDFLVKTLNGESVTDQFGNSVFSSATSPTTGQNLTQPFFSFSGSEGITSLTGTVKMSWLGRDPQAGNGRSFVDFQIRGFNTGANSNPGNPGGSNPPGQAGNTPGLPGTNPGQGGSTPPGGGNPGSGAKVPEPSSTLSLLAFGAIAAGSVLKVRAKRQQS